MTKTIVLSSIAIIISISSIIMIKPVNITPKKVFLKNDVEIRSYGFKCIESVLFYSYRKKMDVLEPVWIRGIPIECDKQGNYLKDGIKVEKELIETAFMTDFLLLQQKTLERDRSGGGIPVMDGTNVEKYRKIL